MNLSKQTKSNTKTLYAIASAAVGLLGLTGCGDRDAAQATAVAVAPPDYILSTAPTGAVPLREALAAATGTPVVVEGRIGGTVSPFAEGYVAFLLADEGLVFCDEMGDDGHCATPWDACCEDPDKVAAARILVQVTDANGLAIEGNPQADAGLAPNDTVQVIGYFADAAGGQRVLVAEGIYQRPRAAGGHR